MGKKTDEGEIKKVGIEEVTVGGNDGKTVKKNEGVATVPAASVGNGGAVVVSKEGKKPEVADIKEEEGTAAGAVQAGGSSLVQKQKKLSVSFQSIHQCFSCSTYN